MGFVKFDKQKFNDGVNIGLGEAAIGLLVSLVITPFVVTPIVEKIYENRQRRKAEEAQRRQEQEEGKED